MAPMGTDAATRQRIVALWRHFAERETVERSALYQTLATRAAEDDEITELLATMEPLKWQPNLLLGAVRYLVGTVGGWEEFAQVVSERRAEITALMAARRTQTNEPARCATLLPVLARLPQPLALLEVGASAGLCLLPDRYAYDYGEHRIEPLPGPGPAPPVLPCRASADTPLPAKPLEVVWRAGLDLHPVDLFDEQELRWLEALIWPGEEYRLPRLRAAIELARTDPPRIVTGDLRTDVPALAAQAPAGATLVVYHTATLGYVRAPDDRAAFARSVADAGAVWIANEGAHLIPGIPEEVARERSDDSFLICVDAQPQAWADPHGTWVQWRLSPS